MLRALCLALLICPASLASSPARITHVDTTPILAGRYTLSCDGADHCDGQEFSLVFGNGHAFLVLPDVAFCFVGHATPLGLHLEADEATLLLRPRGDGTLYGQFIFVDIAFPASLAPVAE